MGLGDNAETRIAADARQRAERRGRILVVGDTVVLISGMGAGNDRCLLTISLLRMGGGWQRRRSQPEKHA